MESFSEDDDQYFDTLEDMGSMSDSNSDCSEIRVSGFGSGSYRFDAWIKNPFGIIERRNKFLALMGLSSDFGNESCGDLDVETSRILRNSDGFSSNQASLEDNFVCRFRNLDDGTEYIVEEVGEDGMFSRFREVGSNRLFTMEEFERILGLCPLVQLIQRDIQRACKFIEVKRQVSRKWLKRLGIVREPNGFNSVETKKDHSIRVSVHKKRSKEISALYMGQDILAHKGSILAMKFSPDGQFLATAGEDGVVRVWKVMDLDRSDEFENVDVDSSRVYFKVNHDSELVRVYGNEAKISKLKSMVNSLDSTYVVFPRSVFWISEKPCHEFCGHSSEVLDLSWSKNKYLLSSSVDNTVRLWQLGSDECVSVFFHSNYVTCAQFNPIDDNYFISGSIDGKVRVWDVPACKVVDWTEIPEIVTAVCYSPDGKGGIVGSINGNCRFYDISDHCLQLNAQICLQSKKKSPFNRITGFQFSPTNPTKLMVSSADSNVRILRGVSVICKFRAPGLSNTGSHTSASFTSDGTHIISASDESNIYMWNHSGHDTLVPSQVKNTCSHERIFSKNTSIAIPWCGPGPTSPNSIFSNPDRISLSRSIPKASATWPEENLPTLNSPNGSSSICENHMKTCSSHAWGLVIVAAGSDGRIRSFQNFGLPIHL